MKFKDYTKVNKPEGTLQQNVQKTEDIKVRNLLDDVNRNCVICGKPTMPNKHNVIEFDYEKNELILKHVRCEINRMEK